MTTFKAVIYRNIKRTPAEFFLQVLLLFHFKTHTVCTLLLSRVTFVRTYLDFVKTAVILVTAMICTVLD